MSLSHREVGPEIMDDPALPAAEHDRALGGLRRLNGLSGSVGAVWDAVCDLARAPGSAPLRILDLATGGGDIPIGLWRRARRERVSVRIAACDVSATALAYGRRRAERCDAGVNWFRLDALGDPIPDEYDVIVCSLFLHHLGDEAAVSLLQRMATAASRRIVVHDLSRSRTNLLMVGLAARIVSRSNVVHHDGPRSVRAAFTAEEMTRLARRAGLSGAAVHARFPCRLMLTWDADGEPKT